MLGLSDEALARTLAQRAEIARSEIRDDGRAAELLTEAAEIGRMLHGLRRAIERRVSPDD